MRYAIGLEYDGSQFLGWQVQRQEPTVQGSLERALARVADQDARVVCWGKDYWGETQPPGGPFETATAGQTHSCAVDGAGRVQLTPGMAGKVQFVGEPASVTTVEIV